MTIDLTKLNVEPEDVYHAQAGTYLSSHQLAAFRTCPLLYHKKREGLIPDADRPAYLVGRAAHALILEGRQRYEAGYAVGGPVNPKTGEPFGTRTKAWTEWAAAQGKPVLTADQAALVEELAASVRSHDTARDLLRDGQAEGVVRAEYIGLPSQIRIDWLHPKNGIVDLKTCDDLTWFEADSRRYSYLYQLAFYRAVLSLVTDHLLVPVHIIAVEKKEPFRCGVWRVADGALASAQRENEAAIRRLKAYREMDQWPTGYEEVRLLDIA